MPTIALDLPGFSVLARLEWPQDLFEGQIVEDMRCGDERAERADHASMPTIRQFDFSPLR